MSPTGPSGWLSPPTLARATKWALALAVALLLLVAAEAKTASGVGGSRVARDAIRIALGVLGLVGALLAWRWEARSVAVGFLVAGLSLLLSALADGATQGWAGTGTGPADRERRILIGRFAGRLLALGGATAVGLRMLSIRPLDLVRTPPRWPVVLCLAFVLGLASVPVMSAANAYGNAVIDEVLASGTPAKAAAWPRLFDAAFSTVPFPEWSAYFFIAIALRLTLVFPLMEALLHGVLRQAFGRWGAIPFVVGTAFLAPFLLMDQHMSFALFVGAVVTGIFAARTASLLPAFAFWTAVFVAQTVTMRIR